MDGHRILPALLDDFEAPGNRFTLPCFSSFAIRLARKLRQFSANGNGGCQSRVLLNVEKTAMGDPFSTGEKEMMKHDPNVDYDPPGRHADCERMRTAGVESSIPISTTTSRRHRRRPFGFARRADTGNHFDR